MIERRCTKCKEMKPLTEFYKHKTGTFGRTSRCKVCLRATSREWTKKNPGGSSKPVAAWREKNRERSRALARQSARKEMSTISGKLSRLMRSRIRSWLKKSGVESKSDTTFRITGWSIAELKEHLEARFQPGMTWDNHSKYGWHIDHIRPLASFQVTSTTSTDFIEAWSLTNLQPLWATDNLRKGASWDGPVPANDNDLTSKQEEKMNG